MTDPRIRTHHKGCAAIDDHHVTDGITFKPCDCCLAEIDALRAKLTEAERELAAIDAVLARRPALDKPTHRENIEHAINTAKRADTAERGRDEARADLELANENTAYWRQSSDEARAKLAVVEAERDRFQEWARGNRDEAEKAWARCHNAEAALAQMREALRDPTAVHAMLLRGDIARPSDANLRHLYPEWEQAESRCAALEALLSEARTAMEPLTAVQIRRHRTDPLLASRIDAALAVDAPATPPGEETPR